jgi:hypothetical protein
MNNANQEQTAAVSANEKNVTVKQHLYFITLFTRII